MELYGGVSQQTLNPGVAFGTLRVLTPEQLAVEPVSFRDVLVLTRLPNELPIVGGSITEELQTPLAHVNVAARARGTPNLALVGASKDPRVAPLVGKLVRFEVKAGSFTLAEATLADADAFWKTRTDRPKLVPEADLTRTGLTDFAALGFSDSRSVGAKAANLAELSRLLPGTAPQGFALPFAHYQAFLDGTKTTPSAIASVRASCVAAGRTQATCDSVAALLTPPAGSEETVGQLLARLLADPGFQTASALRFATLAAVRDLFCALPLEPAFAATLDARVAALGAPARLRSSTNAEDLPDFSGAGLYTSVGATASGAKAASLRLCRVWGSVWNWTAFEERAFWNIDHLAVRMGVAVHPSYPDEEANGVLVTQNLAEPTVAGMYVNVQKGEVSVTNPEGGALPEIFSMVPGPAGVQVARQRFSSLSPQAALLSDSEISALYSVAMKVQQHFAPLYRASPEELTLDLEFKLDGPERKLVIKQARPYFVAH
jgi:phosphoenolpyruvate synthase/pyruvate phosphate dikinase